MPDGSIVLMGGENYNGGNFEDDVWRFMPTGSSAWNPSHAYTESGIYNVALQVFNSGGYDSTLKIGYITVTESSAVGILEVKSSPSHAKIYINGVDTGEFAKLKFDDMAPADYEVTVTLEGYTPETEHVTVVSEQTAKLHFHLKKEGTPVPEFPTLALPVTLIIGFLGSVLYIKRTKEH